MDDQLPPLGGPPGTNNPPQITAATDPPPIGAEAPPPMVGAAEEASDAMDISEPEPSPEKVGQQPMMDAAPQAAAVAASTFAAPNNLSTMDESTTAVEPSVSMPPTIEEPVMQEVDMGGPTKEEATAPVVAPPPPVADDPDAASTNNGAVVNNSSSAPMDMDVEAVAEDPAKSSSPPPPAVENATTTTTATTATEGDLMSKPTMEQPKIDQPSPPPPVVADAPMETVSEVAPPDNAAVVPHVAPIQEEQPVPVPTAAAVSEVATDTGANDQSPPTDTQPEMMTMSEEQPNNNIAPSAEAAAEVASASVQPDVVVESNDSTTVLASTTASTAAKEEESKPSPTPPAETPADTAAVAANDEKPAADVPMNDASVNNNSDDKPPSSGTITEDVPAAAAAVDSAPTKSEENVAEKVSPAPAVATASDVAVKEKENKDEEMTVEDEKKEAAKSSPTASGEKVAETSAAEVPPPKVNDSNEVADSKPAALSNNGDSKPAAAPVARPVANVASKPPPPQPQPTPPAAAAADPFNPAGKELKVEDALLYLDQVKLEFGDRPRIYNQFLEIMKNFKAQEVDTIGVINSVRKLFHGYNNLILGFNTFLPEGYKIEMRDLEPVFLGPGLPGTNSTTPIRPGIMQGKSPMGGRGMPPGGPSPPGRGMPMQGRGYAGRGPPPGRGPVPGRGVPPGRGLPGRGAPILQPGRGQMGGRGPPGPPGAKPPGKPMQQQAKSPAKPPTQQQPGAGQRAVEFDHAIMYVTNIKKRFASNPSIYHTFLEILHTYQKEQRGIKEVLEQVSSLFADHPDLLREFTFFLPDAVQEQAKERLSRAAAEAEAKQRAALEAVGKDQHGKGGATGWRTPKGKSQSAGPLPASSTKFIDMTKPHEPSPGRPSASPGGQQDAFVYNSGVERQFFDAVKAVLTSFSRDGQAYAEFIKTLDMYAQEILSRNDLLGYVERLLGKHKDLFEEFKRIINAIGSPDAPAHDDSWHSVPLSEIDFSRCRRCSPSYRALPRDYPNPPCSERSKEEAAVLNDVWVSLPVGSEESYTFRHMRKNNEEETLFRCEDMRFEIDMCIDSNATTLQRLVKINDELQFLSDKEPVTKGSLLIAKKKCPEGVGAGGKLFQYTLDGRVLGVIHKHAIRRIYGDDGQEMLDLCFKNPAVAIPIVVNRLRQKDKEFRAAREVLNRKWKEISELNYYKSIDHRGLTWRATDKRATSTRVLVADIKDRAENDGYEGEAALSARLEKAKEEHGTFYEVTMIDAMTYQMDLKKLPKPTKTLFTPHLSLMYEQNSWAQQDAYRILSFALERSSMNPADKERCYKMWRDFIGPWFELSLSWMQSPAASFTPSPPQEGDTTDNGDDDSADEEGSTSEDNIAADAKFVKEEIMKPTAMSEDSNYFSASSHIAYPPDTLVSTTFGEGKIANYHEKESEYEVSYASGSKRVQPDAIFCTLTPVEPSLLTDQLRSNDNEVTERADDQLIIGTQYLYLFFRLHQVLVRRLNIAKDVAARVCKNTEIRRHIDRLTYEGDPNEGRIRYEAFLSLVYSLVETGAGANDEPEGVRFEDRVRYLLGNDSYELATMDKLIAHILKHLQHMANDETLQNMIEIYRRHKLDGSFKPSAFREEAALMSEGENMYAFQLCNVPKLDKKILHFEYLGCIAEDIEEDDDADRDENKRGLDDAAMEEAEQVSKRPRRGS